VLKRSVSDPRRVAEGRLELAPVQRRFGLMARALTGRW